MSNYFYTGEEEKRLVEIISELERHPYIGRHFSLPFEEKLIRISNQDEEDSSEPIYERFRDMFLRSNFKADDPFTVIAEMLLIAEKAGYVYSLAESDLFSKQFTSNESFLNYLLDEDEAKERFLKAAEWYKKKGNLKMYEHMLERADEDRKFIPIAELNKSGDNIYLFHASGARVILDFIFVRKNSPEQIVIPDIDFCLYEDSREKFKKFLN